MFSFFLVQPEPLVALLSSMSSGEWGPTLGAIGADLKSHMCFSPKDTWGGERERPQANKEYPWAAAGVLPMHLGPRRTKR